MAGGLLPGSGYDLGEMSEINVTPFIDVMLVLLIIFMVAAPLSTVDAPVDLPVSTAKPAPRPDKPVFVTLRADLTVLIGETPVTAEAFELEMGRATKFDFEKRVFVRADRTVPYGEITRLMNMLRASGHLKLALVGLEGAAVSNSGTGGGATPAPAGEGTP
ncbi:MAG: TonB system transport protein ExbD [Siculibacillus sp.]|nr:TonB system transport protein ExbD [Siculibacillus sp.]